MQACSCGELDPFPLGVLRFVNKGGAGMKRVLLAVLVVGVFAFGAWAQTYDVASDTTWPPFEWADSAGHLLGFDLDLMRCIA